MGKSYMALVAFHTITQHTTKKHTTKKSRNIFSTVILNFKKTD